MGFHKKLIDSSSMMSRLNTVFGFKRTTSNSTSVYILSSHFLKELKFKLREIEHDHDEDTIIETTHKFIGRRLEKSFRTLIEFKDVEGWKATIKLLSTPQLANQTLNRIVELKKEKKKRDGDIKKLKSGRVHEPSAKQIEGTVRTIRARINDSGEEPEIS